MRHVMGFELVRMWNSLGEMKQIPTWYSTKLLYKCIVRTLLETGSFIKSALVAQFWQMWFSVQVSYP